MDEQVEYYIDHGLSANLDSTFAFEGPEKHLEIWIWPNTDDRTSGKLGLRSIHFDSWVKILEEVNCKILSFKSCETMDSYLLSELSLFVFPHKMILKTCGTTATLACLDLLFVAIQKYVDKAIEPIRVHKISYSRRSFMFPDRQPGVHKNWKHEVSYLNEYFGSGKAYIVGDLASDDHWFLYVGGNGVNDDNEDAQECRGQKFEMLMTDLSPLKAEQFITRRNLDNESLIDDGIQVKDLGHELGLKTLRMTQLDSVFSHNHRFNHLPSPKDTPTGSPRQHAFEEKSCIFTHDAFAFSPCGFSSNSISCHGYYYTLHITPESGWSYASFETNYDFLVSPLSIVEVLIKVLKLLEPGKLSITFIGQEENDQFADLMGCHEILKQLGYKKKERIVYDLTNNQNMLYLNFEKV